MKIRNISVPEYIPGLPNWGSPNIRNLGCGDSRPKNAMTKIINLCIDSGETRGDYIFAGHRFCDYLLREYNIKDLSKVTLAHVEQYAEDLLDSLGESEVTENGKKKPLKPATIHCYLSAVNSIMIRMRRDEKVHHTASEAQFPNRSGICIESRANTTELPFISPLFKVITSLQLALGLRFEESVKLNAREALEEAIKNGKVKIYRGTKGGRVRTITVTLDQIDVLRTAAELQDENHDTLIPRELTYAQFKSQMYNSIKGLDWRFHGQRHAFAHRRYFELLGFEAPVLSHKLRKKELYKWVAQKLGVSLEKAEELETAARLIISEELGHSRLDITDVYVG